MRKLLLSLAFTVTIMGLWAQDFAPSQQAQGYLDAKNVTVDHATGLFHYRVPIYTLKSGDFELPITLNYIGKGVRIDDQPGLVGYNWTLNTGGIVTRTIRGGIADEEEIRGYIFQHFGNPPLASQVDSVNKRLIDGENDIFTAIFNGKSINFLIKTAGNNIVAEPLERTNVRIDVEGYFGHIKGWVITDEYGNKYYFRQEEWSKGIISEAAISLNGIRGRSYISAWHISRIEPVNCYPIIYDYKADVHPYDGEKIKVNEVKYNSNYASLYSYGNPVSYRPFDFSKYRYDFNMYISEAQVYLNHISFELQMETVNQPLFHLVAEVGYVFNPNFDVLHELIDANFRIMGQMADFKTVGEASYGVISALDQLIEFYSGLGSFYANMAVSCFYSARDKMIECLEEIAFKNKQSTTAGSSITMRSPMLDRITAENKIIKFEYQKHTDNGYQIKSIKVDDIFQKNILTISLNGNYNLTQLSFYGKDTLEFNRVKFEYYGLDISDYISDVWGFPKKNMPEITDFKFDGEIDKVYSKIKSLSKITSSNQGEIMLDYEPNVVPNKYAPEILSSDFGGIRIKSLVLKDPATGIMDRINYIYPYPGELAYFESFTEETVNYGMFSDEIIHSRAKTKGNAFLNTGNNGVYYDYVEEEFVGKGKKTYLFFNQGRLNDYFSLLPYKFWCYGLPLGIATYDVNGNLKSITKNHYELDIDPLDLLFVNQSIANIFQGDWFTSSNDTTIEYSKTKPQISAYEYYLNYAQQEAYFQNQGNVPLYRNGPFAVTISPYYEVFLPNIASRCNVVLPEQRWNLMYGGKVLLKSQEEYRIECTYSSAPSINHFIAANLGVPFKKIEYAYENIANSIEPTRISTTDSRGDNYTSVIRRVVDMDVPGVMSNMKDQNILLPVVKRQALMNGKLLNEVVAIYGSSTHDDKTYFGVTEERMHISATNPSIAIISGVDNSWCQSGMYSTEKTINYTYENNQYVPVCITDRSDVTTSCYDFTMNVPILTAKGYNNNHISATNLASIAKLDLPNKQHDALDLIFKEELLIYFLDAYSLLQYIEQHLDPRILSVQQIEYVNTQGYKTIKKAIESIATGFQNIDYSEFIEALDDYRNNESWLTEFVNFLWVFPITHDYCDNVEYALFLLNTYIFSESIYTCLYTPKNVPINIGVASQKKFKFYLLSNGIDNLATYTVIHSEGILTGTIQLPSMPYWTVHVQEIDLSGLNGITSVQINTESFRNIAFQALVPADCPFEATSYNSDGTVFCKFNQNGQMERYEYDGAGRVVKMFDHNGKLLKVNAYNVNLP